MLFITLEYTIFLINHGSPGHFSRRQRLHQIAVIVVEVGMSHLGFLGRPRFPSGAFPLFMNRFLEAKCHQHKGTTIYGNPHKLVLSPLKTPKKRQLHIENQGLENPTRSQAWEKPQVCLCLNI